METAQESPDHLPQRNRRLKPIPEHATTLVIRNVPGSMSQRDVTSLWPPEDTYDYIYLPRHPHNQNAGYAFLNFLSNAAAQRFYHRWHGRFITGLWFPKSLNINVARLQGLRDNLAFLGLWKLKKMASEGGPPLTLLNNKPIDPCLLYLALGLATQEEQEALRQEGGPESLQGPCPSCAESSSFAVSSGPPPLLLPSQDLPAAASGDSPLIPAGGKLLNELVGPWAPPRTMDASSYQETYGFLGPPGVVPNQDRPPHMLPWAPGALQEQMAVPIPSQSSTATPPSRAFSNFTTLVAPCNVQAAAKPIVPSSGQVPEPKEIPLPEMWWRT